MILACTAGWFFRIGSQPPRWILPIFLRDPPGNRGEGSSGFSALAHDGAGQTYTQVSVAKMSRQNQPRLNRSSHLRYDECEGDSVSASDHRETGSAEMHINGLGSVPNTPSSSRPPLLSLWKPRTSRRPTVPKIRRRFLLKPPAERDPAPDVRLSGWLKSKKRLRPANMKPKRNWMPPSADCLEN